MFGDKYSWIHKLPAAFLAHSNHSEIRAIKIAMTSMNAEEINAIAVQNGTVHRTILLSVFVLFGISTVDVMNEWFRSLFACSCNNYMQKYRAYWNERRQQQKNEQRWHCQLPRIQARSMRTDDKRIKQNYNFIQNIIFAHHLFPSHSPSILWTSILSLSTRFSVCVIFISHISLSLSLTIYFCYPTQKFVGIFAVLHFG